MIYDFLQFFVTTALKFYFRTIYYLNEEAIPPNQPIIITANHSNSALDALLISGLYKRKDLFWLARGDIFSNKWMSKFLTSVKTAPIYRASEVGYVDIKRNAESFKVCFELLGKNKMVGIFPEGITIHERRMQTPFKKGFARLALQAHQQLGRPITIMPVGVSYHSLTKPRTDAFVKYGKPFTTEMFYEEYLVNPNNAFKNITQHLENQLNDTIINYDKVKDQTALKIELEKIQNEIAESDSREFGLSRNPIIFEKEMDIVNNFINNELGLASEKQNNAIKEKISLIKKPKKLNKISIFLLTVVIFVGKIIHYLPNQISKYIVKTKIKKTAFWGTVRFVTLYGLFPITILFFAFLASFISQIAVLVVLFIFPLFVYLGLRFESLIENRY